MDLEAFELVLLRRPEDALTYADDVLERIQHEHLAYHARLREGGQVLARLGFLGLTEDAEANTRDGRDTRGRISLDGPVVAMVVPTDEELMIARDTARLTNCDSAIAE